MERPDRKKKTEKLGNFEGGLLFPAAGLEVTDLFGNGKGWVGYNQRNLLIFRRFIIFHGSSGMRGLLRTWNGRIE